MSEENKPALSKYQQDALREDLRRFRAEFMDEYKLLVEAEHKASEGFDKALLTLSASFLGFTITFLQNIAASPPRAEGMLYATWILFALSVSFVIGSLFESRRAHRETRQSRGVRYETMTLDYIKQFYEAADLSVLIPETTTKEKPDRSEYRTHEEIAILSGMAILCFLVGLLFLIWFAIINY